MPANLMFLGPPGSGKGTQAARLMEATGLVQLSSGDALRKERKLGTPVGQEATRYMDSGELVPDDVIMRVMFAQIDRIPAGTGFILDGFPRTVPQAEMLDRGLAERRLRLHAVIDFVLSDADVIARIVQRRVCAECGSTYNTKFLPPARPDVCDRCSGKLVQRPDDKEEVVANRLRAYRRQTEPLIEYYRKTGLLREVHADRSPDVVYADVQKLVTEAVRSA